MSDSTLFTKTVKIGRVVLLKTGAHAGKPAAVVNVVDLNRVQVHGPETRRIVVNLKNVVLTNFAVDITVGMRQKGVLAAWKRANIDDKFAKTAYAKREQQRAARANTTDFDRFKIMLERKRRAAKVNAAVRAAKKKHAAAAK
mmetsp:Transcript_57649/g.141847  ORF Transcript_57649/g.141847 Transcript_57649/m.141847 type:complete len:142 (-) Transcript_57649:63-488(-)